MGVFPIVGGERIVQRLLGKTFMRFSPPLLVTQREVLGANAVVGTGALSWYFQRRRREWRVG